MGIGGDDWSSAILGAVVSAVFAGTLALLKIGYTRLRDLSPIRQLLGRLGDPTARISVFVKLMRSCDGKYYSEQPNYFPPHTEGQLSEFINIPYVVPVAEMESSADLMHLLGRLGRKAAFDFKSAQTEWNVWDVHMFVIGGSNKAEAIIGSCEPKLVEIVQGPITLGFKLPRSDELFCAIGNKDYGLILKTIYPPTGVQCFVVMGMGSLATAGAAYFLRQNAAKLGRAYGPSSFAVIVEAVLEQGKQSARLHRWNPEPKLSRVILHPSLWGDYRRLKGAVEQRHAQRTGSSFASASR